MKILICGLPGSGKSTLADKLAPLLSAVHFNADNVRALFGDTDFSIEGRVRQAKRMGELCDMVSAAGHNAIADFVCPTKETRAAFDADHIIYCDTIAPEKCRFPDTAALFDPPMFYKHRLTSFDFDVQHIAQTLMDDGNTAFDWYAPSAFFIGRFQPFHDGHLALVKEGIKRMGQACIAVRARKAGPNDPQSFADVRMRIRAKMAENDIFLKSYAVIRVPNVAGVFYGRDVGYEVTRIDLPKSVEAIRGRDLRPSLQGGSAE